jgi:DNA recombination protein RmuC
MQTFVVGVFALLAGALFSGGAVWLVYSRKVMQLQGQVERAENLLEVERTGQQQLRDVFANLSSEALQQNNERFLQLAQERMERQDQVAKSGLQSLIDPLRNALEQQQESLKTMEQARQNAYGGIDSLLKTMQESQKGLQAETGKLVQALSKPSVRGQWGEIQLQRVVELAGMREHCDFVQQQTSTNDEKQQRPDMIVKLPNKRNIVVDAKMPFTAYFDAMEATEEQARVTKLKEHAKDVRKHVKAMNTRAYHAAIDGAHDFTVLFIPGEAFYHAALEHDPNLLEDAFNQGIILVSPVGLLALLKTVATGWREERLREDAHTIQELGDEMYKRLKVVTQHLARLGKSLNDSVGAYNKAVGSIERNLLTSARRMHEYAIGNEELETLPELEESAREFVKSELVEEEAESGERKA